MGLNLQTQRLFGQQALAEFSKVHIDPNRLKVENDKIEGFRKNTCLINTGNNLTLIERKKRIASHIEKYGIPKEVSEQIIVPVVLDPPAPCNTLIDEIEKLREMYRCVYDIQLRLKQLKQNGGKNAANISVKAKNQKKAANNEGNVNKKKEEVEDVEMKNDNGDNGKNEVAAVESNKGGAVDEDVAMAMALSMSMQGANINTPAIEKKAKKQTKKKKKKKSAKKKKKKKKKK